MFLVASDFCATGFAGSGVLIISTFPVGAIPKTVSALPAKRVGVIGDVAGFGVTATVGVAVAEAVFEGAAVGAGGFDVTVVVGSVVVATVAVTVVVGAAIVVGTAVVVGASVVVVASVMVITGAAVATGEVAVGVVAEVPAAVIVVAETGPIAVSKGVQTVGSGIRSNGFGIIPSVTNTVAAFLSFVLETTLATCGPRVP